jgi:hypothetical protein
MPIGFQPIDLVDHGFPLGPSLGLLGVDRSLPAPSSAVAPGTAASTADVARGMQKSSVVAFRGSGLISLPKPPLPTPMQRIH